MCFLLSHGKGPFSNDDFLYPSFLIVSWEKAYGVCPKMEDCGSNVLSCFFSHWFACYRIYCINGKKSPRSHREEKQLRNSLENIKVSK